MFELFAAFAFLSVAAMLLAPKQEVDKPKPSALGEFQVTTAEEGRAIPIIMGTCKISSPNVTWFGDLGIQEMRKKVKTGPCSSTDVTTGYKYYLGVMLSLCMGPIDELQAIWLEDKLAWSGSVTKPADGQKAEVYVNAPDLFGGEGSEGGIRGYVSFYFGTPQQVQNGYYAAQVGGGSNRSFTQYNYGANYSYWDGLASRPGFDINQVPAFRHVCYVVLKQTYLGTSNYVKQWSFVVKRIPNLLGIGEINGDANPVEMIYELMVNTLWGLNVSTSLIDEDNFRSVAYKLQAEKCGLSMQFDAQSKAQDIIDQIIKHIDASLFIDPSTGKFKLKLIRNDYTVSALPEFNVSNVASISLSRISWPETYNEVKINYLDRASNFQGKVAQAIDLANYQVQLGEVITQTLDLKGFSNASAATAAAARYLKILSYPMAKITMVTNRQAYNFTPGDVFRLTWQPLGITNQVFRVLKPNTGTLEDGKIEIEAIEDVYGLASAIYSPPSGTSWVPAVVESPQPLIYQAVLESPYFFQGANRWVSVVAARNNPTQYQYEVWTAIPAVSSTFKLTSVISTFTPTGTLIADMVRHVDSTISFIVSNISDMGALTSVSTGYASSDNILAIGNELISWSTITDLGDSTYRISGVYRGVLDTVPQAHSAGSIVYFVTAGTGLTANAKYDADVGLWAKLLPRNSKGVANANDVATLSIATQSRALRPYPPGNLQINNKRYPTAIAGPNVVLTWSHRNRVQQGQVNVAQQVGDIGVSIDGTYTVKVYFNDALRITATGITSTSYDITHDVILPYIKASSTIIRCEIFTVSGSYDSNIHATNDMTLAGYGMCYGQNYGGV